MAEYKLPGVYIEEISRLPPSVAPVETAIPAFIGYTQKAHLNAPGDLINVPYRIRSMTDYETFFGGADPEKESIEVTFEKLGNRVKVLGKADEEKRSKFLFYYSLQMFFSNGGGPCWVVSVGDYTSTGGVIKIDDLERGLKEVEKISEVTLLLFPDAMNIEDGSGYYNLYKKTIGQCVKLRDRFTVLDVYHRTGGANWEHDVKFLRDNLAVDTSHLKYAAAYFPRLYTKINFIVPDDAVRIVGKGASNLPGTLSELKVTNYAWYLMAKSAINDIRMLLPVSPAIAGIYSQVDNSRGVWKAPANININGADRPEYSVTQQQQEGLNVAVVAGKSINAIRSFTGRGPAIVWGARTLAGNDNAWRYIPVVRFFIMVEESTKNATSQFIFEPNDSNTWIKVRSMIVNYLTLLWRSGALMGATTRDAFFVRVGLGQTMTVADVQEGRMIVEIGMAVVRPAEFIILRFEHKMQQELS